MAHKQKFTKVATGHMFSHYDRSKEVPDLKAPEMTALNYNLAQLQQPEGQLEFLHKRLSQVKVHNRKDVNVMVDWVVTAPKILPKVDEELFFKETYNFLNNRYGKENVISAYVHLDEMTPHMHYSFVPVVEDRKKGGLKLSAKEAVTREDLRTFHKDLSKHLEKIFGRDIGILNDATVDGNKSIDELKRESAIESMKEINQEKIKAKNMTLKAQEFALESKRIVEELLKHKKGLEGQIKALEDDISKVNDIKLDFDQINAISGKYGILNKNKVTVNADDFRNLKEMAKKQHLLESKVERLERENYQMNQDLSQVKSMEYQMKQVKKEKQYQEALSELNVLNKYLEKTNQLEHVNTFKSLIKKSKNTNLDLDK